MINAMNHNRYAHARQMRRTKKELRKLKNYLGRIVREMIRKLPDPKVSCV